MNSEILIPKDDSVRLLSQITEELHYTNLVNSILHKRNKLHETCSKINASIEIKNMDKILTNI